MGADQYASALSFELYGAALSKGISSDVVLVVDLDGTLLRSDMLLETFWSSFASDWRIPLFAARSLVAGRAAMKQQLTRSAQVDAALLPYNTNVILDSRTKCNTPRPV